MQFERDEQKAEANLKKHEVSFDEAKTVFDDPLFVTFANPDYSFEEKRFIIMGESNQNRLPVVSYTERLPTTRLINAGAATRTKRKKYEEDI